MIFRVVGECIPGHMAELGNMLKITLNKICLWVVNADNGALVGEIDGKAKGVAQAGDSWYLDIGKFCHGGMVLV